MKAKSVVLLSAGLDSTVNFYAALKETQVELALTFNYGQKSATKEIERARELSALNNVKHKVVELPWLKDLGQSGLTSEKGFIPTGKQISLDNQRVSTLTAKAVWIPNRNGIFMNIAAGFAESLEAKSIIPGFNAEEAASFPDNSFDFIRNLRKTFSLSTANGVDVQCFTITMTKPEIVKLGKDLNVPFERTWPCYLAEEKWCGECESCQRAIRAFKLAKVDMHQCFLDENNDQK